MKAILINGQPKYQSKFIEFTNPDGSRTSTNGATEQQWIDWGFKDVVQATYTNLQKLGDWYDNGTVLTQYVIDKTQIELDQDVTNLEANFINEQQYKKLEIANAKLVIQTEAILSDPLQTTDTEVLANVNFYDYWDKNGISYKLNKIVKTFDGQLYRCVQAHTSQVDWSPELVPALFTPIVEPGTIGNWVQPTGAHDAYQIGDQVNFDGSVYESLINANVWSPTAYPAGWQLI